MILNNSDFLEREEYKSIERKGITAIVLNKGKILLLKRINLPFLMVNPGLWYFVAGSRSRNENYLDTAYREIKEEISIDKLDLKPLIGETNVMISDNKKRTKWENAFFIFCSKTDLIKLNFEHTAYKWISFDELLKEHEKTTNAFYNKNETLEIIKSCINKC